MKEIGARLGYNLGFIDHIVLIDGTVIHNMQVLGNAPIPSEQQIENMFLSFNDDAQAHFEKASPAWSKQGYIPIE